MIPPLNEAKLVRSRLGITGHRVDLNRNIDVSKWKETNKVATTPITKLERNLAVQSNYTRLSSERPRLIDGTDKLTKYYVKKHKLRIEVVSEESAKEV
jgi:hypothetical protein